MSLSQVLLESRKDDFLKSYQEKFTPEQIKKIFLTSRDLATNQKFLMFLGKVLSPENFDENLSTAQKTIEKFIKYQQALEQKDINVYNSIEDIVNAIKQHENKVRRDVKTIDGADVVFENDRFTVVTPKSHKASCYYGAGTKWCTASTNGSSHFDNYNVDGKLFYILDKKAKSNDRFYKVALLQKYDGDRTFYDAPDKAFSNEWILGTPEWDEIQRQINEYLENNFSEEIEIFKDKEKARLERERIRKLQIAQRNARRLADAESRKENDEWNLEGDIDEEGEKANAVFEVLQEYGVTINEDESIYNLIPAEHPHYELSTFEWLGEDDTNTTWAVGDWDEVYESARDYYQNLWDDMGVEGWSEGFVKSHLDEESVKQWFVDMFEEDINSNYEHYFDSDDLPLSREQETQIEKLEDEKENLEDIVHNSEDEDEINEANERIEEIDEEIEEINENPEGEPTIQMVEDLAESLAYDKLYNVVESMVEYGLELSEFIDVDALISDAIDSDGTGPALSSYDGAENEANINGTWYYVYKVD